VYGTNTTNISAAQTTANFASNAGVFGSNTSVSACNTTISLSNFVYGTNTTNISAAQTTANFASNAGVFGSNTGRFGSNTSVSASNTVISLSNFVYGTNTTNISAAQTTANFASNAGVFGSNTSIATSNYAFNTWIASGSNLFTTSYSNIGIGTSNPLLNFDVTGSYALRNSVSTMTSRVAGLTITDPNNMFLHVTFSNFASGKLIVTSTRPVATQEMSFFAEYDINWNSNIAPVIYSAKFASSGTDYRITVGDWYFDAASTTLTYIVRRGLSGSVPIGFYTIGRFPDYEPVKSSNLPPGVLFSNILMFTGSNGNIGIRTITPTVALDVNGTINATTYTGTTITNLSNATVFASNTSISASNTVISLSNYVYGTNTTNISSAQTTANFGSNAGVFGSNTAVSASNTTISLSNYVYGTTTTNNSSAQTTADFASNAGVFGSNTSVWSSNNLFNRNTGGTINGNVTVFGNMTVSNATFECSNLSVKRDGDDVLAITVNEGNAFIRNVFTGDDLLLGGACNILLQTFNTGAWNTRIFFFKISPR
jgi:hypothetical protein